MSFTDDYLRQMMREEPLEKLRRSIGLATAADLSTFIGNPADERIRLESLKAAALAPSIVEQFAKTYGGVDEVMRRYADQQLHEKSILDAIGGLDALRRSQQQHWATVLAETEIATIVKLSSDYRYMLPELESAQTQALGLVASINDADQLKSRLALGLNDSTVQALETTSLKMSVLAGIGDLHGVGGSAYLEATHALIGDWHTHPDLPKSFWRDRRVRERHYQRADVDRGLIATPAPATVEILVESGLAAGVSDETGAIAFVSFGGVAVTIRSAEPEIDAARALRAFERQLRQFIGGKLEALEGPSWFKRRVSQDARQRAQEIREAALKSGEQDGPMIDFTELGHLKDIVLRKDNWETTFEAVFISRERFEQDMLTLLALRRPTVHSRNVDSPRLVEALFVMQRLGRQMAADAD